MLIDFAGPLPRYQQIYKAIRLKVLTGELTQHTRLPSSRNLADELHVSRNVVLLAYEMLVSEGYLVTRPKSGIYVAAIPDGFLSKPAASLNHSDQRTPVRVSDYARNLEGMTADPVSPLNPPRSTLRYDFRHGHPAVDVLSERIWRRLVARQAGRLSREFVAYGPPQGHLSLREAVAQYLRDHRGVECNPDCIVIVNGAQQALDLAARVLVNPGDPVVVEEPCYPGTRQPLIGIGARVHPIRVDDQGLVTDELTSLQSARLICVTPSHQYPTGAVMPLARRLTLIAYARKVGAFIIEDDYDSEFRYDARPEKSVQGLDPSGPVLYVGTLSKALFPALRLGYVVLPRDLVQPFIIAKSVADRCTPTFFQGVVREFISQGHLERHLRHIRAQASERRHALIDALASAFGNAVQISGENAGLHLLAWFSKIPRRTLADAVRRAMEIGVGVYPVDLCYVNPPKIGGLVMGYASMTPKEIFEGVRRLAKALGWACSRRIGATKGLTSGSCRTKTRLRS